MNELLCCESLILPRLLYGIISAFVVGMADLYFVIRHLLETEGIIDLTDKKES